MESIISQSISGVKGQRSGKLEDTKRVISSHKSKDKQYNGQYKSQTYKYNDSQNTT